jgi:hypothetical protein
MDENTYQYRKSRVVIPPENIRLLDESRYDWTVQFLREQIILKRVSSGFTSLYLQDREIVAFDDCENRRFRVGFTHRLNKRIKKEILDRMREED